MTEPPDLESAIAALESDKARDRAERDTGASDDNLDWAIELLRRARQDLDAGRVSAAQEAVARIVHQAIDAWELTSQISDQLASLKGTLGKLDDQR